MIWPKVTINIEQTSGLRTVRKWIPQASRVATGHFADGTHYVSVYLLNRRIFFSGRKAVK